MSLSDTTLPRRTAKPRDARAPDRNPSSLARDQSLPYPLIGSQLAELRIQVPGVRGSVLGGVDGLLIADDVPSELNADELAAMAATSFGLGRQIGARLGQGAFRQSTVRNESGYLSVYAVGERALLSVVGADTVNVARLHLYAPPVAERLATLLTSGRG